MVTVQSNIADKTGEDSLGFYVALQSTGILEINFDPSKSINESLSVAAVNTDAGFMPGWLTGFGDTVYSISRTQSPGSESDSGEVFAFRRRSVATSKYGRTGLELFSEESSNGKGGVHCDVSPDGKILAAANITASSLSIYPLSADGAIGKPTHVFDYNHSDPGPQKAHPHQAAFDPSGRFLIVPLRTLDRVDIYSIEDPEKVKKILSIPIPGPAGARHVAFNQVTPHEAYMYLVSEKDNMVWVFALEYNGAALQDLSVKLKQTLSTMGKDIGPRFDEHKDLAAEIAVSNDGKFVYVSNRNLTRDDADTLAIYSVDLDPAQDERHLTYLGCQETRGKHPRMFALSKDPESRWVAIAHQFSQDIIVFERDTATGFLRDIRGKLNVKVVSPHESTAEKVRFTEWTGLEGNLSREELLTGRTEGPVCVLWK